MDNKYSYLSDLSWIVCVRFTYMNFWMLSVSLSIRISKFDVFRFSSNLIIQSLNLIQSLSAQIHSIFIFYSHHVPAFLLSLKHTLKHTHTHKNTTHTQHTHKHEHNTATRSSPRMPRPHEVFSCSNRMRTRSFLWTVRRTRRHLWSWDVRVLREIERSSVSSFRKTSSWRISEPVFEWVPELHRRTREVSSRQRWEVEVRIRRIFFLLVWTRSTDRSCIGWTTCPRVRNVRSEFTGTVLTSRSRFSTRSGKRIWIWNKDWKS